MFFALLLLELILRLSHLYGMGKKRPLPIYTFMRATVTTSVSYATTIYEYLSKRTDPSKKHAH